MEQKKTGHAKHHRKLKWFLAICAVCGISIALLVYLKWFHITEHVETASPDNMRRMFAQLEEICGTGDWSELTCDSVEIALFMEGLSSILFSETLALRINGVTVDPIALGATQVTDIDMFEYSEPLFNNFIQHAFAPDWIHTPWTQRDGTMAWHVPIKPVSDKYRGMLFVHPVARKIIVLIISEPSVPQPDLVRGALRNTTYKSTMPAPTVGSDFCDWGRARIDVEAP